MELHEVTNATYLDGYRIEVAFDDVPFATSNELAS